MRIKNWYIFALIVVGMATFFFLFPDDTWARAGGGRSKAGGIVVLILWPFFLIYSAIISYYAVKKNNQCKVLLRRISGIDPAWAPTSLKKRIEKCYFKVQEAWGDRDQNIAKEFMSERLYKKHKMQTDDMLRRRHRNEMHTIKLIDAKIVEILDFKDDSKDSFWALIHGSMADYLIDERTNSIIDGDNEIRDFKELWWFKREGDTWVLDEIDQDVSISDIRSFDPYSEHMPGYKGEP
jgi:hypothetical protein